MIKCDTCEIKSQFECQLCRDADNHNYDIINIQKVLD